MCNARSVALGAAEALLLETLGSPLLAYLLAVDEAEIDARLEGSGELRPAAEAVLQNELLQIAEHVAAESSKHQGLPPAYALQLLGSFHEPSGTSVGNALRLSAGGSIPQAPDPGPDPLKSVLVRLAGDAYAVFWLRATSCGDLRRSRSLSTRCGPSSTA
jgi:hypothetical protein